MATARRSISLWVREIPPTTATARRMCIVRAATAGCSSKHAAEHVLLRARHLTALASHARSHAGKPGSVLVLRNDYRLRPACTSTADTLELIRVNQKRSRRFPSPNGTLEQWLGRRDVRYQVWNTHARMRAGLHGDAHAACTP